MFTKRANDNKREIAFEQSYARFLYNSSIVHTVRLRFSQMLTRIAFVVSANAIMGLVHIRCVSYCIKRKYKCH